MTTVCQFVSCKEFPKTSSSYFKYYVNGKVYKENYGQCPPNYESKIGKYFILHYSNLDPEKITVDFSDEVTDTEKIFGAGFKTNE
ncbi:hypothetical protein C8P67_11843 [Flavobacterium aquicola]|uniref:Uncharacterized protein n=2 Tax=Flavobacterium aquicola TaxID=1682742 RepID=A0A3E0DXZ3_9FLAO|nr:hypothetical protein C8P67_11843 [Flavobacterium aquicola]